MGDAVVEYKELWAIFVPTVVDDKPVWVRHHREWDRQVRALTGGITILKPAIGQWIAPDGELFKERVIPVQLACDEETIDRVIDITMKHYRQLAVMAYRVSNRVIIKHKN